MIFAPETEIADLGFGSPQPRCVMWFRREERITWFAAGSKSPSAAHAVVAWWDAV